MCARAPRPATPQATSIPAPMGGSFASRSPSRIAASSCRRPMAAQAGIGATTGAAHGNESQPYRQPLRLRAPLHPRHAQDEATGRAGLRGHARDGARAHPAGACSPNALTGPDSTTGQRLSPSGDSPASATPDRESPAGTAGAQGSSKPEKPGADDKKPAQPRLLRLPVRRRRRQKCVRHICDAGKSTHRKCLKNRRP